MHSVICVDGQSAVRALPAGYFRESSQWDICKLHSIWLTSYSLKEETNWNQASKPPPTSLQTSRSAVFSWPHIPSHVHRRCGEESLLPISCLLFPTYLWHIGLKNTKRWIVHSCLWSDIHEILYQPLKIWCSTQECVCACLEGNSGFNGSICHFTIMMDFQFYLS